MTLNNYTKTLKITNNVVKKKLFDKMNIFINNSIHSHRIGRFENKNNRPIYIKSRDVEDGK